MSETNLTVKRDESLESYYEDLGMLENDDIDIGLTADDSNPERIKLEPPEVVVFKEEPIDGEFTSEGDQDPILHFPATDESCLFCQSAILEKSTSGPIRVKKIEFVLNTKLQTSEAPCCSTCWDTFKSFYKFKRSCLQALSKRVEAMKVKIGEIIKTELECPSDSGEVVEPKNGTADSDSVLNTCKICFRKFKNSRTLLIHMQKHRDPKHWCEKCGEKFFYTTEYKKHSKECIVDKLTDNIVSSKDLPVPKTDPETQQDQGAAQLCQYCNESFPQDALKTHQQKCKQRPRRSHQTIQCALCPKRFAREESYQHHLNHHNGIRTVQCRIEGCTKMFYNGKLRYEHEKNFHDQQKVHICPICGALLRTDRSLRQHVGKHRGPRFECELCQKKFSTKDELRRHSAVHTGERNFECQICFKRFKSYEANRVHQRIHTQETPYACTVCGQQFRYNCLLKTHMAKGH